MEDLNLNKYQELAVRTSGAGKEGENRQVIAALGLAGEAGEFANLIKKLVAHGHKISKNELTDELGDVLWYLAEAASSCNIKLEDIAHQNIEKLKARYPDGFSQERSINRGK